MSWLFGAGMGFLFGGGPLGAVVGGVLEHMATKRKSSATLGVNKNRQNEQEAIFITNLAVIMTKVAMADGRISLEERRVIHTFFANGLRYKGEDLNYIDAIISETEKVNPDLRGICKTFNQMAPHEMKLFLLDIIYQIALADNLITEKEQLEIDLIAVQIGISEADHNRIKYKYLSGTSSNSVKDNYKLLGIGKDASVDEIKKAYKQMALQYHPDRVSHLGEELIEFANSKFKEINEAYETIKKQRSI